jgi:hypothetical protein
VKLFLAAFVFAFALAGQVLPLGSIPIQSLPLTVNSQMPAGAGVTSSASPWTFSFTNTAGTVIYLFLSIDGTAFPTVTVTYGGGAMTQLGVYAPGGPNRASTSGTIFAFRRTLPATGSNNFVITWNTGAFVSIAGAISFTGNNAVPDNGLAVQSFWSAATGTTFSLTQNGTTAGNIVLQASCYGDAGHSTQSGTISTVLEVNGGSQCNNLEIQYQSASAGSTTTSFTNSVATSWATLGIEVKAASNPASLITALPNGCNGFQNGAPVSSTISCNWDTPPPAGSNLVCGGTTQGFGSAVTGLAISDGTAFTPSIAARDYSTNHWILLAYRFSIGVTAPATVTLTLTGTDQFASIVCNAFTDSMGTPTADGTCTFGTTTSTAVSQCTSAIVTTGTDYVIGLLGTQTASKNPPPSFWGLGSFSDNGAAIIELQIQGTAGSITPTYNTSTGTFAGVNGFAIKP